MTMRARPIEGVVSIGIRGGAAIELAHFEVPLEIEVREGGYLTLIPSTVADVLAAATAALADAADALVAGFAHLDRADDDVDAPRKSRMAEGAETAGDGVLSPRAAGGPVAFPLVGTENAPAPERTDPT